MYQKLQDNTNQTLHISYKIFLFHLKLEKNPTNFRVQGLLRMSYLTWHNFLLHKLISHSRAWCFSSGFCSWEVGWYTCGCQFSCRVKCTVPICNLPFIISYSVFDSNIFHLMLFQRHFLVSVSMPPEYPFTNYCLSLCIFMGRKVLCYKNKKMQLFKCNAAFGQECSFQMFFCKFC